MQASGASSGIAIDLSRFKIETHVRVALRVAVALAGGNPLRAADLLNAALIVSSSESSPAFSAWAAFFPAGERRVAGPDEISDAQLDSVLVNESLGESFDTARLFLERDGEIWGRDYLTIALLAQEDPSLDELASRTRFGKPQPLRDAWYRFLISDKNYRSHRPWEEWWTRRGIRPPAEAAPETPQRPLPAANAKNQHAAKPSPAGSAKPQPQPRADVKPAQRKPDIPPKARPVQGAPTPKAQASPQAQTKTEQLQPQASAATPAPAAGPAAAQQQAAPALKQDASPGAKPGETVPPRLPDVWMLSDRPLESKFAEQDRFQFKDYADALATVIDHQRTETPFAMAINAPCGAGKTTLANMVAEQLTERPRRRGDEPHIICWFNAWMNDDAPNLATAFVSEVARVADRNRNWFWRIFTPLPSGLLTPAGRNWRRALVGTIILGITFWAAGWLGQHLDQIERAPKQSPQTTTRTMTADPTGKTVTTVTADAYSPYQELPKTATKVDRFIATFQSQILILGAFFTALAGLVGILVRVFPATALEGFVSSPDKAAETGTIQAAARQLKKLIEQATWRGNRFIVFVDDIERCTPPRSVDVLDAVNQLMSHTGVVIVFLGDMSAVAASAQLKYKDLAEIFVPSAGIAVTGPDHGKEAFGRLYVQKIIQFQFDLPIPAMPRIQEYMRQLAATPAAQEGQDG